VLAAYREAVRRYGQELWVTGISIGLKEVAGKVDDGPGPVIAIHVRMKASKIPRASLIPRKILGIVTDVIEGTYTQSAGGAGSAPPVFPLRPGSSFARSNGTAATLAGVVRDQAGVRYLLTTAHALREGGKFKPGDLMVHPGPADSQQPVGVARYERVFLGIDAGIARLEPGIQVNNRALLSNRPILTPEVPKLHDILEKSGEASQLTRGEVRNFGTFGNVFPAMRLVLLNGEPSPISKPGDSGSTWYDVTTSAAKGLHIGIDLTSNESAAIAWLFPDVIKSLKVTWELSG
jgi:hypothetical protein